LKLKTPLLGGDLGVGSMRRKILSYNPELKAFAKKLRSEMTIAETILWKGLKQKQMMGFDFDRQRPIDNYIVDFYCKDLMLAIEVDGATHYTEEAVKRDSIRQTKLENLGIRFLRFDDDDVKTNVNGVLDIIRAWIVSNPELVGRVNTHGSNPPPNPSKEGSLEGAPSKEGSLERRKKDKLFHFKKFSVRHDRSSMKVGTDGVLLGAWVDTKQATHVLDIGTGTGVIALMLAQRTNQYALIEAIEIDQLAFEDATENFNSSAWKDRLILHHGLVQSFTSPTKFDLIVSNPPYFQSSFKPPNAQRILARHTENLSFQELISAVQKLLSEKGKFNVVLPYTEGLQFIALAEKNDLHCSRKWSFKSRKEKPIERWLLEFSRAKVSPEENEILLYNNSTGEEWSVAYQNLTRDFYLKL
jgi:tRNA1Val (adenine37-N6)-methyltransferase